MTDRYITIKDRQVKVSDALAELAAKRAKLETLADPFAASITQRSIAATEAALVEAGIAEDAVIVADPAPAPVRRSGSRSAYYGSATATAEDAGDINNLLLAHGNAAAAE